jgi:hypothetical protein
LYLYVLLSKHISSILKVTSKTKIAARTTDFTYTFHAAGRERGERQRRCTSQRNQLLKMLQSSHSKLTVSLFPPIHIGRRMAHHNLASCEIHTDAHTKTVGIFLIEKGERLTS